MKANCIVLLGFLLCLHDTSLGLEMPNLCNETDFVCAKNKVDDFIAGRGGLGVESLVGMLGVMKGNDGYRDNLLGLVYMLQKDDESIVKARDKFLASMSYGIKEAAQNLAELYFAIDDYNLCMHYLNEVHSYGYVFPDEKYLKWARLKAQVLYLSEDDGIRNVEQSLSIFSKVKDTDKSGVAKYFLGYHALHSGQIDEGIKLLIESVNLSNKDAAILLADQYYSGESVEKDISQAKKLYEIAGEAGSGRAFYNLAMISQQEHDINAMKMYLIRSANLGYDKAVNLLKNASE